MSEEPAGGAGGASEAGGAGGAGGSSEAGGAREPAGSRGRRGPLREGERVQLTDTKGRMHTITLAPGKQFHTSKGAIEHDALLGGPEGVVVTSTAGMTYLAVRPLLSDFVLSMPRGATVVYPKDAAQVVGMADVYPGARVVEAGVGSGALTCTLLRAVGDSGVVSSYERREDFAEVARRNVETFFEGPHPAWRLTVGDAVDAAEGAPGVEAATDRVVLDMLAPWEVVPTAERALVPGGVLCCYVATTTQLARTVETVRAAGFTEPLAAETLVRGWHVLDLAVRPDHRMVAHTGFLVTARRLAPGVTAPSRRRRPVGTSSETGERVEAGGRAAIGGGPEIPQGPEVAPLGPEVAPLEIVSPAARALPS